jgi:hypothetical protein
MVYEVPRTFKHGGIYYCEHVPLTALTFLRMHPSVNKTDLNNSMDSMFNGSKPAVFE